MIFMLGTQEDKYIKFAVESVLLLAKVRRKEVMNNESIQRKTVLNI